MKARFSLFLGILVVIRMTQVVNAASASWTGTTDTDWQKTANWGGATSIPGSGEIATFNGAGNGNVAITNLPTALSLSQMMFSAVGSVSPAAYTISANTTTWSIADGGGVSVGNGVTTNQNLSGIQFIRPAVNSTVNFNNQGSGLLKIGTIFSQNAGTGTTNARLNFTPGINATIELSGSLDNAGNNSSNAKKMSILLNDAGTLKISGSGSFDGTDADGNSVTIRQGTLMANTVANASPTWVVKSSLGTNGRIQFGEAGQARTATLDYYNAANATTDRAFHIIDNNTAVFKVSGGSTTNLTLTTAITQSAATNGGGKVTKDGAGILTLSAANTFTGDTLINNGKIALGIATALQNSAYDTTGSTGAIGLDVTGFATPTLGGLKGNVNLATVITGYGSVTNLTLNPQAGKSNTYAGVIANGAGGMTLTKSGSGTQILSGDNSFTGNVTVNAGTLKLTHSNALGTGTKGFQMQGTGRVLELSNNITLGSNITLNVSSNTGDGLGISNVDGTNEIQGQVNISTGNPAMNISSVAGTLTISGNVTLTATTRTLYLGGASTNANTISGIISETGGVLPVTKQGLGTWVLTNANTYTGNTSISAGKLALSGGGAIGNSPTITVASGATLDVSAVTGGNWIVGANQKLTGSGGITGATTISGKHNAGDGATNAGVGSQAFSNSLNYATNSIFEWDIDASSTSSGFDTVSAVGNIDVSSTGTVFKVIFGTTALGDVQSTGNPFWNTPSGTQTWNISDIFGKAFTTGAFQSVQTSVDVSSHGAFTINSTSLTWTAVPEPTSALTGLLITAGLLRRRRTDGP